MNTTLETLLYAADDHYLSDADISTLQQEVSELATRVETYEYLRDRELAIVQPAADYLIEEFPTTDSKLLERAVAHWLSILRYAAMAMLRKDNTFMQNRLLEWIPDFVEAYQLQDIELAMHRFLQVQLKGNLSPEQLELLNPYLQEAYSVLMNGKPTLKAMA